MGDDRTGGGRTMEDRTVLEDDPAEGRPDTVMVALANPDHVEQLMRTAIDLAADNDGQIRVVSVIHKHVTSPFLLFSEERIKREFADDQQAVLDEAVALAEERSVPVKRSLLVGSDVSDTILSTVEQTGADSLLLGWQERSRPSDIMLGTTLDPLVRRAPCDVFVERVGTTSEQVDAVLLPTDGGPHVEPGADLAEAIARSNDASVTVVSYVPRGGTAIEREAAQSHVDAVTERLEGVPVDEHVREAVDVADAIVDAAADHDLVVLGATRERQLRRRVIGSVAETVARRVAPPVVIAKRGAESSLLGRALEGWWG
jgi:nucleotide-binding universal stress UspA family protein